jgi:hypothetical protein
MVRLRENLAQNTPQEDTPESKELQQDIPPPSQTPNRDIQKAVSEKAKDVASAVADSGFLHIGLVALLGFGIFKWMGRKD